MSPKPLPAPESEGPILFIDGVCHFCEGAARFVLEHEQTPLLRFAALQGELAQRVLPPHGIDVSSLSSMVLLQDGVAYSHADGALQTARLLRWPWRMLSWARVLPAPLLRWGYLFFARHRYQWFGKKDSCLVATPALRARFLQDTTPLESGSTSS